jgi:GNAT superfamily N-acetyltransferase
METLRYEYTVNDLSNLSIRGRLFLDEGDMHVVRAYRGTELVAFAILSNHPDGVPYYYDPSVILGSIYWYLKWFQTEEEYEGRGFGRALLQEITNSIPEHILMLSLPNATNFYLHCGAKLLSSEECVIESANSFLMISSTAKV